jgi:hypothetical protein
MLTVASVPRRALAIRRDSAAASAGWSAEVQMPGVRAPAAAAGVLAGLAVVAGGAVLAGALDGAAALDGAVALGEAKGLD